jgi:SAM-dependent methyltransferase
MPELLPEAVAAFDAAAGRFDERFGGWLSVAAQRRAVRRHLLATFPAGARLIELAGGTGADALFLAQRGYRVLLTDGAPAMLRTAAQRAESAGLSHRIEVQQMVLEHADEFSRTFAPCSFDGAYSVFAGLNCVADLRPVARSLARLLPVGAAAVLVMFGPLPPTELLVQVLRGEPATAFRRLRRCGAAARLGGRTFAVHYPTPLSIARSFEPWFELRRTRGIGIAVPPSAAEPFISRFPRLVRTLERVDRILEVPFARFADHVLFHFVRVPVPVASGAGASSCRSTAGSGGTGGMMP